jgi:hypothetical protein
MALAWLGLLDVEPFCTAHTAWATSCPLSILRNTGDRSQRVLDMFLSKSQ